MTTNKDLDFNAFMAGEEGGMKRDKDIADTELYKRGKKYEVGCDGKLYPVDSKGML